MRKEGQAARPEQSEYLGVYNDGVIRLSAPVNWPDGTCVSVRICETIPDNLGRELGKVIIAGFGLAGRWVADIFDRHGIEYTIVETNAQTVETQEKLKRNIIYGDIANEETLRRAGIEHASILALTIPNEDAVIEATQVARRLNPSIYIVARTYHASAGLQCSKVGADDVIKAEQVVARQFYEMLLRKVGQKAPAPTPAVEER
jgi:voltage-gated potassium channel Kch